LSQAGTDKIGQSIVLYHLDFPAALALRARRDHSHCTRSNQNAISDTLQIGINPWDQITLIYKNGRKDLSLCVFIYQTITRERGHYSVKRLYGRLFQN